MITKCPVCGKAFDVLWPQLWSYKRGQLFLCSWKCLRLFDGKEGKEMARLKKDGTPALRPGPKKKVEVPEQVPTVKLDGPIQIETPEPARVAVVTPEGPKDAGRLIREERYTVTAISYPDIGEFYYDRKNNSIDWRTSEGEEVSMSPTGWKILIKDLPQVMDVLGVTE